jgi:acetylornithine deacetylase/succinyl-diaminopimelate desuccinylase-like protein
MQKIIIGFFLFFSAYDAAAQSKELLNIRAFREKRMHQWLEEYTAFLSIPNIASDTNHIQKNAAFIQQMMKNRGISNVQLLTPNTKGIPPVIYGEVMHPGATKTIIFYAHYDGQPVDSTKWAKGLHPFKPTLFNRSLENQGTIISWTDQNVVINPEWRIYARSASDDKAGVMSILSAYESIANSGYQPTINLKFFFEGEEEAGSDHLYEVLEKYAPQLQSNLWIICDGPVHQSGNKMVSFGVRGDTHIELTVYGSKRPLHSGHYGNWAPNPALMLSKLLASMKDDNGKVLVKGFYDDVIPLSEKEKKALKEIPSPDLQMKKELGFLIQENDQQTLAESILNPSLNINGLQSANVGKLSSNVIPTTATASLDLRLVLGNDFRKQQNKVLAHIKKQGFYVTDQEPTETERNMYPKIAKVILSDGYNAQRTSMDLPIAQNVIAAVKSTTNDQVVLMPSVGGSLPLFVFEKYLKATTITVPIANHDNNQHAENENIRLQNLWNGIETFAAIMMMK